MRRPLLIAGPTGSGKSALALGLAERLGASVINADSQQVYAGWRVLSARPGPEDEARAPHLLFGHVGLDETYSTGRWLREARAALDRTAALATPAMVVGGTGLYFRALTSGLAEIPATPPDVRRALDARLAAEGVAALAAELARRDPATAAWLDLANPARVQRALEVLETTGEGIAAWQAATPAPALPLGGVLAVALVPQRDWLYARCDARFSAMLAGGALDEVRAVMRQVLPPGAPGLKAVGAPELMAHLRGEVDLAAAAEAGRRATRRYAKRQLTWVRNQMAGWHRIETTDPDARLAQVLALIDS